MNPFQVVRDFEQALCEYTGAPYAVTTTSCTMALLLAVAWHIQKKGVFAGDGIPYRINACYDHETRVYEGPNIDRGRPMIEIPKRTYVGVPMSIIHAGGRPTFRDQHWEGAYQLAPLPVIDSARWFSAGMYDWLAERIIGHRPGKAILGRGMVCVSFHWNKTLGIQQGGAILHDDPEADRWLRMARFDGRQEGVSPKDQKDWILGYHAYMSPETAAAGLVRLASLPRNNPPLPNDEYPDLSQLEIFR